ncbi:hypothetical protein P8452_19414 [Trifolium repens]|nr:hypothetical protein P8452_19414 [Trifolium repens]
MAGRWNPQVQGRRNYNNRTSDLIIRSYSQLGVFPHNYHVGTGHQRRICKSHPQRINAEVVDSEVDEEAGDNSSDDNDVNYGGPDLFARKNGVTALTFDTKGKYLAAGTRRGCLTVYNFESLYGHIRFRGKSNLMLIMFLWSIFK